MSNENYSKNMALGSALRAIRLRRKESLLEVSAAIEISGERLARIENGDLTPTEDILHLLVSHYDVSEKEEDTLYDLAGYGKKQAEQNEHVVAQQFIVLPLDNRIMYADAVQVTINDHGVVMNFLQPANNGQQVAVSRVGMSMAHAKSVLHVLSRTIDQSEKGPSSQKRLRAQND